MGQAGNLFPSRPFWFAPRNRSVKRAVSGNEIVKRVTFIHTYSIIIHQTHYEKSDWSRAFNQFTIACDLDMINARYLLQILLLSCQVQCLPGY